MIVSGEPLLVNDVPRAGQGPGGVYYDVDREGHLRKLPDEEPPGVQSAMMLPVKHEGDVVGVVQLMHETVPLRRRAARARRGARRPDGGGGPQRAAARARAGRGRGQRARPRRRPREREQAARVLEAVGDGVFLVDDRRHAALLEPRRRADHRAAPRRRPSAAPAGEVFDAWPTIAARDPDLRRRRGGAPGDAAGRGATAASSGSRSSPSAARTASSTPSAT